MKRVDFLQLILAIAAFAFAIGLFLFTDRRPVQEADFPTLSIHLCARQGNMAQLRRWVEMPDVDVDARTSSFANTPLHFACWGGQLKAAQYLVAHGADVQAQGSDGTTAALAAASGGNLELLRWLLEQKELDDLVVDNIQMSVLLFAAKSGNREMVRYLIEDRKADPWAKSRSGETVLFKATQSGNLKLVRYLLDDCRLESQVHSTYLSNRVHMTALHGAALGGSLQMFKYLEKEFSLDLDYNDDRGVSVLLEAAKSGSLELVKYLVEQKGIDVELANSGRRNCLKSAVLGGNVELLKYLVEEKGVDVNDSDWICRPAFFSACRKGNLDQIRYLADAGANLEAKTFFDDNALFEAVEEGNLEVVRYLVEEKNVAVNTLQTNGYSALARSVEGGNLDVFRYLVKRGAKAGPDDDRTSPLFVAGQKGELGFVRYLLEDCKVPVRILPDKRSVLQGALESGRLELIRYLVEKQNLLQRLPADSRSALLCSAAQSGQLKIVKYLIGQLKKAGYPVDVDAQGSYFFQKTTAIHCACQTGNLELVRYLIETLHAKTQTLDGMGNTILLAACHQNGNNLELIRYLVETVGQDVNAKDESGETSLIAAARCYSFSLPTIEYLVEKGANLTDEANYKKNALEVARDADRREIVQFLAQKMGVADSDSSPQHSEMSALDAAGAGKLKLLKEKVKNGEDIQSQRQGWVTLVHRAADSGYLDVVQYLVEELGMAPEPDGMGETPLMRAAFAGHFNVARYLIEKGANVNRVVNMQKETVLQKAIWSHNLKLVRYLVERGAQLNARDISGGDALFYAAFYNDLPILKYLVQDCGQDPAAPVKPGEKAALSGAVQGTRYDLNMVRYLVGKCRVPVEQPGSKGGQKTVLMEAAQRDCTELVEYFLNHGANLAAVDEQGRSALWYAFTNRRVRTVQLLIRLGASLSPKEVEDLKANQFIRQIAEFQPYLEPSYGEKKARNREESSRRKRER